MSTPNRTARRTTWTALLLGTALVGALAGFPVLAQDAAGAPTGDATGATTGDAPRAGAFFLRRGPDGGFALRGMHAAPRDGGRHGAPGERLEAGERLRGDAFARWLDADADAGPIVPGLIGRVADGTTVRLVFWAGAPTEGGTQLAELTFVAGEGDAAAFRTEVRTAAQGATHVVVDVLGRVVALPEAASTDRAE
jgi:hypothetical protein